MSKIENKVVTINLDLWTTQASLARARGVSIQYINKLIKQGKLNTLRIEILGLVLVTKD